MKVINLGRKPMGIGPEVSRDKKPKEIPISYPEFHVDGVELPLSSADVGKEITATVVLKVKKAGQEIDYDNKKRYSARLCVVSLGFGSKKGVDVKNMSKEDLDNAERDEYSRTSMSGRKGRN